MKHMTLDQVHRALTLEGAQVTIGTHRHSGSFRVHEVTLPSDIYSVTGTITTDVLAELRKLSGLKVVTVLFPGMGPYQALVAENNQLTRDYEVEIRYIHRPDEPVEF